MTFHDYYETITIQCIVGVIIATLHPNRFKGLCSNKAASAEVILHAEPD